MVSYDIETAETKNQSHIRHGTQMTNSIFGKGPLLKGHFASSLYAEESSVRIKMARTKFSGLYLEIL